ncbi:hypothetical protein RM572_19830 [Streptomyces sp. DSM 42041]|uniref:Uncharacterized protein n=1 Tax=Streptomyces hazeniae TaxID=3075538 RepID=A0ABU2NXV0_9ACTN|nr:hypothetical protein [Streptomyces sp. DSM 42041]MDT0381008.1 hypothetical protein [Streptomyces sp. DSM 42041]
MADEAYYADGAGRSLAKKFETQAYDLRAFLKEFETKTGEEAITDGFGVLTESDEINKAYIGYSDTAADAVKFIHEYLDQIADSLRKVNENTEVNDEGMAALFGKKNAGEA